MVRFNRFLGCCLVGIFGLISFPVFAQSQAYSLCAYSRSVVISNMGLPNPNSACKSVKSDYSCSAYTTTIYGVSRSGFLLRENCMNSSGSLHATSPPSFDSNIPSPPSGVVRTQVTAPLGYSYFFYQLEPDPEPSCPGPSAPEFNNLKAPTANGSGDVCIDGCGASIALQAPPLPLFSGLWTGLTCTPSPSNTPQPVGDPNDPPCAPGDSECSGTGTPSDPGAPPNTGGGGFQCDTPPVCNADGVTCSMLYQQWRGRCAAELADLAQRDSMDRLNDAALGTNDRLDGVNDRLDGVNDRLDGVNDRLDTANRRLSDISDNTDRTADGVDGLRGDLATGWSSGGISAPSASDWGSVVGSVHLGTDSFDSTGFGFPRSCPRWQDVTFTIGPSTITIPLSTFELHCAIFEWTGVLIMAFAAYYASRIILTG